VTAARTSGSTAASIAVNVAVAVGGGEAEIREAIESILPPGTGAIRRKPHSNGEPSISAIAAEAIERATQESNLRPSASEKADRTRVVDPRRKSQAICAVGLIVDHPRSPTIAAPCPTAVPIARPRGPMHGSLRSCGARLIGLPTSWCWIEPARFTGRERVAAQFEQPRRPCCAKWHKWHRWCTQVAINACFR
jgi:hypothetical protein